MEIALAASLLVCAGLTLRSLNALVRVDLGFATEHRFTFKTNLTERDYPDAARVDRFYEQLTTRLEALPGTLSIGAISYLPLSGEGQAVDAAPVGHAGRRQAAELTVGCGHRPGPLLRDDGRRAAAGAALLDGRSAGSPAVAIVDDVLARRLWTNEARGDRPADPLWQRTTAPRHEPSSAWSAMSATSSPARSRCRWPTRRSRRSTSAGCTR